MSGTRRHPAAAMLVVWMGVGMGATSLHARAEEETKPPPKERFHVYLLMGQSNMAGRGEMTEADRRPQKRVWMLDKENQWVPASHPLHFDKPTIAGVGLGIDFAKRMCQEDAAIHVGLVPCAFGGTPLSRWSKGGDLYEAAVARAKIAMTHGTLKGVLWHQGESDSAKPDTADTYGERLAKMIQDLRDDLGSPDLPFVAGRLGEFYVRSDRAAHAEKVDAALADLPNRVERTGCASAHDLEHKGDGVHFSAEAMRELGRRYAAEMIRHSPAAAQGQWAKGPASAGRLHVYDEHRLTTILRRFRHEKASSVFARGGGRSRPRHQFQPGLFGRRARPSD